MTGPSPIPGGDSVDDVRHMIERLINDCPEPRPGVLEIVAYVPGASTAPGTERAFKLSSNESPFGPSPSVLAALMDASKEIYRYPDSSAEALRLAVAKKHNLEPNRVVFGCGSNEVIGLVAQAYLDSGDETLMGRYAFSEFPIVSHANGATPVSAPEREYTIDVDALLKHCSPRARIVFIANPNNPTGTYLSGSEIRRLHAALPKHIVLLIDEAYAEYADAPDYETAIDLARNAKNVVVTRTFSKIYGLAGLRIGWGYCPSGIAESLHRIRYPFNVNALAQAAGFAAVQDQAHVSQGRSHNTHWRKWVTDEITKLGFSVTPSQANFVLVHCHEETRRTALDWYERLLSRGIIVRPLRNYGLANCLRISVGSQEANVLLVNAMRTL
jgi:histidinol-phosphate aminotransferase